MKGFSERVKKSATTKCIPILMICIPCILFGNILSVMVHFMTTHKEPNFWFILFVGNVGMILLTGVLWAMYYTTFKLHED